MSRFVVLFHRMPPHSERADHWDWMFEWNGALLTWACEQCPDENLEANASRLDDHRLAYLEVEGPISGDRGHVSRVLAGDLQWLEVSPQRYRAKLNIREPEPGSNGGRVWLVDLQQSVDREYRLVVRPAMPPVA